MPEPSSAHPQPATQLAPLNFSTKLAYGAGDLGPAMTTNLLSFFLLYFFTNVAGLNAGLAGGILLIGKIWDAVNDPIVGVLSDRTRSARWGRRYPWILYGAIPFGVTFFLQWLVPRFSGNTTVNQWSLFGYYVLVSVLFNTFYTMVNLPYTALTPELTQDYNERTSLTSFRFGFSIGGSILSLILAQVIFALVQPDTAEAAGSCNSGTFQYVVLGGVTALLSVLPLYWCVFGTRNRVLGRNRNAVPDATTDASESLPFREQLRVALNNRPFQYVIGIYFCSWLAVQVTASIIPYFIVSRMQLQESDFIQVTLAVQGTALLMLYVWSALSRRYGKKAVYFMGMSLWIIAQAGLFFLQPGQFFWMYALAVMAGFGVSTAYLIPWSMVPDVIEVDELETGQRREGVFYAFMVLLQKMGLAIALFVLGIGLEAAGFQERVPCQPIPAQPESAILAIRLAIGPLPTIALLAGLVLAYFYPITQAVHAETLLRLRERRERMND
jgi:GPH family glycoside/pentoside/hexuronide:cation symporter